MVVKKKLAIFKIMEFKLYNYIMMPSMILLMDFGLILIGSIGFEQLHKLGLFIKAYFE